MTTTAYRMGGDEPYIVIRSGDIDGVSTGPAPR